MSDSAVLVRAKAVRWASDDFPGWVEVVVRDFTGTKHSIVEKVPVLSSAPITKDSSFPQEWWVRGESDHVDADRALVVLDHDVQTSAGLRSFYCATQDVKWL